MNLFQYNQWGIEPERARTWGEVPVALGAVSGPRRLCEEPRRQAAKRPVESRMGHQKIIMVSDHGDFFMRIKGKFKLEK